MERCGPARLEAMGKRIIALQERNWRLEADLAATRGALFEARQQVASLGEQLVEARTQFEKVQKQMAQLQAGSSSGPLPAQAPAAGLPPFIKANVEKKARRTPGRKAGHTAGHRMIPEKIDVHVEVPVPRDCFGKPSCPKCHTQLSEVKAHERIVEDLIPQRRLVTSYHTTSGYCPSCRKRIESRDANQPPAPAGVDLPQSQLGINALSTVALLRMQYRLPYRQIQQLFLDLPGLSISSGAVVKQIQRMGDWLSEKYERLKVLVRAGPSVHMDETGWRIDGVNHWLWTMLSGKATVYHVDKSRGQKVTDTLLGENFTGTLVSDFYNAYAKIDCPKQKCLVHLLRELKETAEANEAFAKGEFCRRLKRLVKEMLLLKQKQETMAQAAYEKKNPEAGTSGRGTCAR